MHKYLSFIIVAMMAIMMSPTGAAQSRTLAGTGVDDAGEPLIGATVYASPTEGTVTDMDGKFTITTGARQLKISYVGFETQTVDVRRALDNMVVRMVPYNEMDEVVVVGYGQRKKESVIGAISTVDPQVLTRNQTANISNALVGALPGVIGVQRSGEPGYDASDFWIRGINTFGANARPLIIIDGIERSLDALSPEEIESFSVLKDASATAVYGVRGANGAIVIKTKRGQVGAPKVNFKLDFGVSRPLKIAEFVDGAKHMEVINAAARLSGMATMPYSQEQIDNTRNGVDPDLYPSVNWLDKITSDYAPNMRVSADVSGGTNLLRYRFVLGVYNEGVSSSQPRMWAMTAKSSSHATMCARTST